MKPTRGRTVPTTDAPKTVTPANAWKRQAQEGELYELPGSGNVARMRRPSLTAMAVDAGHLPNPLATEIMHLLAQRNDPLAQPTPEEQIEAFKQNGRAFIKLAELCFVEPRLVLDRAPNYEEGEIGPGDVPDADYVWIANTLVEGDAAALLPLRR